MTVSNFQEARQALNAFVPREWSMHQPYTLQRMIELMNYLDNPQNKLKIVHVAGTSGKTSTAYYIASLLNETGIRVGLTVSPHVTEINERLQIGVVPLKEKEYCSELSKFLDLLTKTGIKPTYFELLVAFAYWEFARQEVDYAVIEVGLGGLLDGTNVVDRKDKVCVITDIGLDHTRVLGSTLPAIAKQKAGIITNKNVVFVHGQDESVMEVIQIIVKQKAAKLFVVESAETINGIGSLPTFQQRNFILASKVVEYIVRRDSLHALQPQQIMHASQTLIPARMEIFYEGGKTIIIDGAHNAQKLGALAGAIKTQFPNKSVAALVSFVAGGEERLDGAIKELAGLTHKVIVTTFSGEQDTPKHSVDPAEVLAACKAQGISATLIENPVLALAALQAQDESILLVTGSFFLLNHIRPLMLKK
jgi:dihydrofolate synthase/folylpolyglutamate synthase